MEIEMLLLEEWKANNELFMLYEDLKQKRFAHFLTIQTAFLAFFALLAKDALGAPSVLSLDRVCSPARQGAMMRLLGRFIDMAEAAQAAGVEAGRIGALACLRALQRMGEDIGDDQLDQLAALEARIEREFAQITPATPAPDATPTLEPRDAAHG